MTSPREVAAVLADAGVASPQHDARALVAHADGDPARLDALVRARASRVPLQHLLGTSAFRYLELAVGPGVFVPRPETELLVDDVLRALAGAAAPLVVDLCAGSGAIGLSVARECPAAEVHLVEAWAGAFEWLARNAAGFDRVHLHRADLALAPLGLDGTVDVVVSNPPYVPLAEQAVIEPEVGDHDPPEALWGGEDGLDVIRRVVPRAAELLRSGGMLVVEHSESHEHTVPALFTASGFVEVSDHLDLTGRPRYCTGTLR